jgi:NAD(P)-dependent dehydrogenase (short-subunit alcohol dehydrogenase family)
MAPAIPFGSRSTADKVLAGIDLTGKHILITGCSSGLGFETMSALCANGAHVIGLARSMADAEAACAKAGASATPVACNLSDLDSIAAAGDTIGALKVPLDSIVANAGIGMRPSLRTRYGVEMQFLVNHIGHFALVNRVLDQVRNGTGRIVIVSSSASINRAPVQGIMFDNLDGGQFYKPLTFYGQSKLANALFAKELSRRLNARGIVANSLHPGATHGTLLNRAARLPSKLALTVARPFMRSVQRGAATQALLAAHPAVAGVTGRYWANCRIADGSPLLEDAGLAARLWEASAQIVERHTSVLPKPLQQAA